MMKNQPANPEGTVGKLLGHIMTVVNRPANRRAARLLGIKPTDCLLEIGFGPGDLVALLSGAANLGYVAGIDVSSTMLAQARKRNRAAIAGGVVDLRLGSVTALPFANEAFDKVVAVHSFQFWPDPEMNIREVWRVLRPGGLLLLAIRRHKSAISDYSRKGINAVAASGEEIRVIRGLLEQSGFTNQEVHKDKYLLGLKVSSENHSASR